MNTHGVIQSQYHASLEMLKQAIVKCPESLWFDPQPKNKYWHLAYHTLVCTHLYLEDHLESFTYWPKHRENYQFLGKMTDPPYEEPVIGEPYSKDDVLEYFAVCKQLVDEKIPTLDLEAESGFYWLPFSKLELQFYNIRHIQHHAGGLIDRLRNRENDGVDWIRMQSDVV